MSKIFLFSFLAICFSCSAFASQITCPPYLGNQKNSLFNLGVIGAQSEHPDVKTADEIMPDSEVNQYGGIWNQYYYPEKHKDYKKLFLVCVYHDQQSIMKEITSEFKTCILQYSTQSSELAFSCF